MRVTTRFAISDIPLSGSYCNDHMVQPPVDEDKVYMTRHSFLGVTVLGEMTSDPCDFKRSNGRRCGHKGYIRVTDTKEDLCLAHTNAVWRRVRSRLA